MATPQTQQETRDEASLETKLEIRHICAAPRERVFRAWTDARELAQWFHPTPDHCTVVPELDLRVGGKYRVEMHHKGGAIHRLGGTYREIHPPEKLVYTWGWNPDKPESVVTMKFRDLGNNTEIHILHQNLPDQEQRDKHNHGWLGCLIQLDQYLA